MRSLWIGEREKDDDDTKGEREKGTKSVGTSVFAWLTLNRKKGNRRLCQEGKASV
jgi:hypothetical protein